MNDPVVGSEASGKCEEGRRQSEGRRAAAAAPQKRARRRRPGAAQARHHQSSPRKEPSRREGRRLARRVGAEERRATLRKCVRRQVGRAARAKLEAVAAVRSLLQWRRRGPRARCRQACEAEPHAAVAKAAIRRALRSRASPASSVGAPWSWRYCLGCAMRNWHLHAQQALNDVSQIQPEVVFDDATVRAATDALASAKRRLLPPAGRACGFRWASSAFAASSKAPPLRRRPGPRFVPRTVGCTRAVATCGRPRRPFGVVSKAAFRRQVGAPNVRCEDARQSRGEAPT